MDLLDFGHSQSGDSGRSDCHYSGHDYDGHGLRIWNQGCAAKSSRFFLQEAGLDFDDAVSMFGESLSPGF